MRRLTITTVSSAGVLIVLIALLMLFPRDKYFVVSTVLAVLFWILLTATLFLVCLLIRNIRKSQQRMVKRNPGGPAPLMSPDKNSFHGRQGVNHKKDNDNNWRGLK